MGTYSKIRKLLGVWVLAFALACLGQAPKAELPKDPNELVRAAIANELKSNADKQRYEYRVTKKLQDRTEVKQMVDTPDGTLGRLILINGKPLTPEQRAKEDARLQRLIDDPAQMSGKRKEQQDDDRRTREMVKAMPDAFIYEYAGTENKEPWGEIAVLKFKPNPNFDPPNQETKVYRGMQGEMWIDLSAMRLAKIEAKLFRDVAFGWGILGHLDQGGQFIVEQKPVSGSHWEPSHMVLNFTGKVLLFKTLKIRQDETTSDYKPVTNMGLAQALDFLKKQETEVAQAAQNASK
jgi:hypothetical protein